MWFQWRFPALINFKQHNVIWAKVDTRWWFSFVLLIIVFIVGTNLCPTCCLFTAIKWILGFELNEKTAALHLFNFLPWHFEKQCTVSLQENLSKNNGLAHFLCSVFLFIYIVIFLWEIKTQTAVLLFFLLISITLPLGYWPVNDKGWRCQMYHLVRGIFQGLLRGLRGLSIGQRLKLLWKDTTEWRDPAKCLQPGWHQNHPFQPVRGFVWVNWCSQRMPPLSADINRWCLRCSKSSSDGALKVRQPLWNSCHSR